MHIFIQTILYVHKTNLHRNKWMWFLKIEYMNSERGLYWIDLGSNELSIRRVMRFNWPLLVQKLIKIRKVRPDYSQFLCFLIEKILRRLTEWFTPINENERIGRYHCNSSHGKCNLFAHCFGTHFMKLSEGKWQLIRLGKCRPIPTYKTKLLLENDSVLLRV